MSTRKRLSALLPLAVAAGAFLAARSGFAWGDFDQGCNACHRFRSGNPSPHARHVTAVNLNCVLCHENNSPNGPVRTYRSPGGLPGPLPSTLGCTGCHGHDHGEVSPVDGLPKSTAAGLRLYHAARSQGGCFTCHTSDPAALPEDTVPVYYQRSEVIPTDPCLGTGIGGEDMDGDGLGLDNDGDSDPAVPGSSRDQTDPDCGIVAGPDLSQSAKCFGEGLPCSTSLVTSAGATVNYVIAFVNTGTGAATSVTFSDDLDALGAGCAVTPTGTATCTPVGTGCGAEACTVTQQPGPGQPFQATMATMPPGCIVQVRIDAVVDSGTTGCCNTAAVEWIGPLPGISATPAACFDVEASGCDLNRKVVVNPAAADYSADCGGGDLRLPGPPFVSSLASDQDLSDTVPGGAASELILYQLACGCGNDIRLYTRWASPGAGVVHIQY